MTKHQPRHAKTQAKRPTAVVVIVALMAIVVGVVLITSTLAGKPQQQAVGQPPPPQPTWTVPVPVTSQVCIDAIDAAREMKAKSRISNDATIKAARLASEQKFTEAGEQIVIAQEAIKKLVKAEDQFEKYAERCEK